MSLPEGWTPLALSPARPLPQSAPLPGAPSGTQVALVASVTDLARLLSVPGGHIVHAVPDTDEREAVTPGGVDAFTVAAPDSLATAATPVHLVVTRPGDVLCAWPARVGRALPVRSAGTLLGHLWVGGVVLAAGTLVSGGHHGSRISIGWRPLEVAVAAGEPVGRPYRHDLSSEVDPYDRLV